MWTKNFQMYKLDLEKAEEAAIKLLTSTVPWVGNGQGGLAQRVGHDWMTELNWTDRTIDKAREFQKNVYFCFIDYTKAFDCVDHN